MVFKAWLHEADRKPFPKSPDRLTAGSPLTNPDDANDTGQVYHGPVALLVDGLTYSAADIFAAGFQDHKIGPILGYDTTTGGGGGNVWRHNDVLEKLGPKPGLRFKPLPRDVSMTLAIRRCSRVHEHDGVPIEDRGVSVTDHYQPVTIEDVVAGYPGLVTYACAKLSGLPRFRIDVPGFKLRRSGAVAVDVKTESVATLRFFLDGRQALEARTPREGRTKTFIVPPVVPDATTLRIEGFSVADCTKPDDLQLTAVRTVIIRESEEPTAAAAPPALSSDIDPITGQSRIS